MTILIRTEPLPVKVRWALVVIAMAAAGVLFGAALAAEATARRARPMPAAPAQRGEGAHSRLDALAGLVLHGREELRDLGNRIAAGEIPSLRAVDSQPAETADPAERLGWELQKAHNEAWNALVESATRQEPANGLERRVEVFVNLSLRMQTLLHRALQSLDELENRVEDPDLLKELFRIDHLTARVRRQAESLAVVGGAAPRRQWSRPVSVHEVLRSAIAEVEQYARVKVVPPVEGTLDGGAVSDVVHLLAELIENATKFAPPHTEVFVRVETVTAGLAVEIEDRGLGIPVEAQHRLNDLLYDAERLGDDRLLEEGRIGLLVVAALSRRHKIAVRLQANIYGGTQAVVVIPHELIGSEVPGIDAHPAPPADFPGSVPAPSPGLPPAPPSRDRYGPPPSPVPSSPNTDDTYSAAPSEPWPDEWATMTDRPDRQSGSTSPVAEDGRPELPKRRAQTNFAPEPTEAPLALDSAEDVQLNHGLMAAFRQGMRDAEQPRPANGPNGIDPSSTMNP
ncbi:ATP-binding protein [Actinomadura sp. NPDC048394]|uniref:sensor histidine kinase n=1 Tax=Actinomadura sp. NPDC048394 TaxID=3158223 RepID=UPI0033ED0510